MCVDHVAVYLVFLRLATNECFRLQSTRAVHHENSFGFCSEQSCSVLLFFVLRPDEAQQSGGPLELMSQVATELCLTWQTARSGCP